MYKSKIDIPVLILFFCRDKQLEKVFESVKQARPSKLYLYQDGARPGREDDVDGINRCREVVSDKNIDWECEVHRLYQEKNYGCDPSEYMAQKWMFSTEEMGIVLEDDDVPAQSFFPYCKELLLRYKDDTRINMICGMNNLEKAEWCPYSYLFTTSGSITGWASWKRVIDMWDSIIPNLDDLYFRNTYCNKHKGLYNPHKALEHYQECNDSGIEYYEAIMGANLLSNNMLNIVPTLNQISNIGVAENATHSVSSLKMLPKGIRRIFFMKTYELELPLKHPPYVMEDVKFKKEWNKVMGTGLLRRYYRKMSSILLRIRYGDFKGLLNSLKRKACK